MDLKVFVFLETYSKQTCVQTFTDLGKQSGGHVINPLNSYLRNKQISLFFCCCKWYLWITFHHTIKWAGGSTGIKTTKRKKGHSNCGNVDWRFSHKSFFSQRSNSVLVLLPDSLLLWWYQVPKSLLIYTHIQTHTEPHTHGYTHSQTVCLAFSQFCIMDACFPAGIQNACRRKKEGRLVVSVLKLHLSMWVRNKHTGS